ncbi:MAG: peptidoglycan-binding protein [Rhizobiaceae bacterium]|nr:peptidoglycan-binding protein [Rhizobiaceae bacterium]
MTRSAKRPKRQPEPSRPLAAAASGVAGAISRNPALVGGSTAFLVALSFVSANALWYQPFAHPDAFFSTREIEHGEALPRLSETTINIERPEEPVVRKIEGDPVTKSVQAVLKELNLYQGTVDGLSGPNTRKAVEAYQRTVGLPVTGTIDQTLLEQLDTNPTAAINPVPAAKPSAAVKQQPKRASIEDIISEPLAARFEGPDNSEAGRIRKLQAGLKQSGRKDIEVDGIMGSRTRSAIEDFQARNGLPKTGLPDEAVFAAMRKKGLID